MTGGDDGPAAAGLAEAVEALAAELARLIPKSGDAAILPRPPEPPKMRSPHRGRSRRAGMPPPALTLYTYWRSQASFRVRVALRLKGLEFRSVILDLMAGDQFAESYRSLNPEMVVPALIEDEGPPLVQSLAILEYLDERYPDPPLLPSDARGRAHARALAHVVASDTHPLIVPRVRKYLEGKLGLAEPQRMDWIRHWLDAGSSALEGLLARDARTGRFCCGDAVTVADICLVAHFTSAIMLTKCDVARYPTAARIYETCMGMDAFASTHPLRQPDAPDSSQAARH
jgi:maleylacetoacetate isomerase